MQQINLNGPMNTARCQHEMSPAHLIRMARRGTRGHPLDPHIYGHSCTLRQQPSGKWRQREQGTLVVCAYGGALTSQLHNSKLDVHTHCRTCTCAHLHAQGLWHDACRDERCNLCLMFALVVSVALHAHMTWCVMAQAYSIHSLGTHAATILLVVQKLLRSLLRARCQANTALLFTNYGLQQNLLQCVACSSETWPLCQKALHIMP